MRPSVLVPLDLGFDADRALPVAESLARRIGAGVEVVGVTSPGVPRQRVIAEVHAHARRLGVDVDAVHVLRDHDVAGEVLALVAASDAVLCCATHAWRGLGERLFHSVSAEIVRRTRAPVVLVGPRAEPRPALTAVLAGIDEPAFASRVASTAAMWSRPLGTGVRLLRVVQDRSVLVPAWSAVRRVSGTLTCLGVDTVPEVVVADRPADAILATAGELGDPLVVVGAHDRSEVEHPALGGVSLAVVRRSTHPVLVVPTHADSAPATVVAGHRERT